MRFTITGWSLVDSLFFCFAALATIGIFDDGDKIAARDAQAVGDGMFVVCCTLYVLFGLALMAMCFNLVLLESSVFRVGSRRRRKSPLLSCARSKQELDKDGGFVRDPL